MLDTDEGSLTHTEKAHSGHENGRFIQRLAAYIAMDVPISRALARK
jgi:hypothetical protein